MEHGAVEPVHAEEKPKAKEAYPAEQVHAVRPGEVELVIAPPAHVLPAVHCAQTPNAR